MKSFITFLAILFLPAAAAAAISDAEVESALDRLDRELTGSTRSRRSWRALPPAPVVCARWS